MTSFAHQAAQIDTAALAEIPGSAAAGLQGADHGGEDADRPVEPDVPAVLAQRPLRAAQEAAGPAAEKRARGRPRVPRHEGAGGRPTCRCRACCTCARTTACSARRSSSWSSSTARCSGTRRCRSWRRRSAPSSTTSRTGRWPRCIRSIRPRWASPTSARPGSYFARQRDRWTKQYRASETEHIEDMETLIAWLEQNEPPDDGRVSPGARRLPHRQHDLQAGRLAPAGRDRLGAVHHRPSVLGPRLPVHAVALSQSRDHARPRQCRPQRRSASPPRRSTSPSIASAWASPAFRIWKFCLAFSFFRLAAIVQGVKKRGLEGNASNPGEGAQVGRAGAADGEDGRGGDRALASCTRRHRCE